MSSKENNGSNGRKKKDEKLVESELRHIREFVGGLKMDDLKEGDWFEKLVAYSLSSYTEKVDAEYFRNKYPDLPSDAIVQLRIDMAARYASLEGGLSASAYTTAVAATIGSGGGASPMALPAGGTAFVVDTVYLSYLQLRCAYDISVLYSVPVDTDDPDDLWKLIKIAFVIKAGEGAASLTAKWVPVALRPVIRKFFSGSVLAAVKSLPLVGKHILRRNIVKFSIPAVGVPASVAVNYWTTRAAGQYARESLRMEAKLAETAGRAIKSNSDLPELLWAIWLVVSVGGAPNIAENQLTFFHRVIEGAKLRGVEEPFLAELRNVVEVDETKVWAMLAGVDDVTPIYDAVVTAVAIGGKTTNEALRVLHRIAEIGDIEFCEARVQASIKDWK